MGINGDNTKQAFGIQVTFILKIKLHKYFFKQNLTISLATDGSILSWCYTGNLDTYATTKEPKKKVCTINNQNENQKLGMQVTFILKINLEMYIFIKM